MWKQLLRIILVLSALWLGAHGVLAGPFHTRIIGSADEPLVIEVAGNVFLQIRNFTQEGGAARGSVTVTIGDQTANVLTASQINTTNLITPLETINRIVIAGPATVTVNPVVGANLTITYRKVREGAPIAVPTATPTPTPTATPTPTPTP
jgi:hypothetical protein